jgi:hypothetical protein
MKGENCYILFSQVANRIENMHFLLNDIKRFFLQFLVPGQKIKLNNFWSFNLKPQPRSNSLTYFGIKFCS